MSRNLSVCLSNSSDLVGTVLGQSFSQKIQGSKTKSSPPRPGLQFPYYTNNFENFLAKAIIVIF